MKYAVSVVVGYIVGWTITYVLLMKGDFRYFFRYFQLAWTQPGELPTFINLGALIVAVISPLVLWVFRLARSRIK